MTGIQKAIAVFGGATALAFGLEFSGAGVSSPPDTTTPQPVAAFAPSAAQAPGSGVHVHLATLTGCVIGLGC